MSSRPLCLFLNLRWLSTNWNNRLRYGGRVGVPYKTTSAGLPFLSFILVSYPQKIDPEEINEYLAALACDPRSPSRSSFKHMVYGLRYYYRLSGMNREAIALPSLKKDSKLPVILNRQELKELFAAPTLLKQRIVLTLIYSAGLRGQEVINLKISDIDFDRKTIHIRQSKYKKDCVVPLAGSMAICLKKYLKAENPHLWLFNGKEPDGRYSVRGLSRVMRENLKKTSIAKEANLH